MPLDKFHPRAITSQEREGGLCPATQYPSLGAKEVASQTQLTSCSKDKLGKLLLLVFLKGFCYCKLLREYNGMIFAGFMLLV